MSSQKPVTELAKDSSSVFHDPEGEWERTLPCGCRLKRYRYELFPRVEAACGRQAVTYRAGIRALQQARDGTRLLGDAITVYNRSVEKMVAHAGLGRQVVFYGGTRVLGSDLPQGVGPEQVSQRGLEVK